MTEVFPERLQKVEFAIADVYRVSIDHIRSKSKSRRREVVQARQIIWAIAHELLEYSYTRLGHFYGKDHTTVRHGVLLRINSRAYHMAVRDIESRYPGLLQTGDKSVDK